MNNMINPYDSNQIGNSTPNYLQNNFLIEFLNKETETNVINFLKNNKVDIHNIEINGVKLIHFFVQKGWQDGLRYLIDEGYNINESIPDMEHSTPLSLAVALNNPQIASILLDAGADLNQPIPQFEIFKQKFLSTLSENAVAVLINNSLTFFISLHHGMKPEWQDILKRKEINVSFAILHLFAYIIPNYNLFEHFLKNFKGDINTIAGNNNTLTHLLISPGSNSEHKLKCLDLLLDHPQTNLKTLSKEGFSTFGLFIEFHPDKLQSEILQKIQNATNGFGELVALQALNLNKINCILHTESQNQPVKFETCIREFSILEIKNSLITFIVSSDKINSALRSNIQEILWANNKNMNAEEFIKALLVENKIIVFGTGWNSTSVDNTYEMGHAIEAVFFNTPEKTYLLLCNRGPGASIEESGIIIYEISKPKNNLEFSFQLSELCKIYTLLQSRTEQSKQFISSGFKNSPLLKKSKVLKHKEQRMNNCSWLSPKTTVRACLIGAMVKSGIKFEDAVEQSLGIYKDWTDFDRHEYGLNRLLNHPYCQESVKQREAEGILLSRLLHEFLMYVPLMKRSAIIEKIQSKMDPKEFELNFSPLHLALLTENYSEALKLIENGAAINSESKTSYSPLHLAAWLGKEEIVKALIQNGATASQIDLILPSPAHIAFKYGHKELGESLIEFVSDVNLRDQDDKTLFHYACEQGCLTLVKNLLNKKANPNLLDNHGKVPLHFFLLNWEKVNSAEDIKLEVVNQLASVTNLNVQDEGGSILLHYAIKTNCLAVIEIFLKEGSYLNVKDKQGGTALHIACDNGDIDENIIEVLLKSGCLSSIKNIFGIAPLHFAVAKAKGSNVVRKLLENGADPSVVSNDQATPLHFAVSKDISVAKCLLEYNANPNLQDADKETPLHFACTKKNIPMIELLAPITNLKIVDVKGFNILHSAVATNNKKIVEIVLKEFKAKNLDLDSKEAGGRTALLLAFCIKNIDTEIIELLIDFGADTNAKLKDGRTPLVLAKQLGYNAVINKIVEKETKK